MRHNRRGGSDDPQEAGRKTAQLCRQAEEALTYAMAGSADARLREMTVVSVSPAPDASRLLMTVRPGNGVSSEEAIEVLDRAHGYLRSEVAAAIHRRKAPDLAFTVIE